MPIPRPVYLYRIIHIANLPYIIGQGFITCPSHENADTNYIGIGDSSLIRHRRETPITLSPFGTFNDYIAFYFGRRSPMLYNIRNGFQGVTRLPNNQIIYLITSFEKVQEFGLPYVYFNGHGYHHLSQLFNTEEGLSSIDWDVVNAARWNDTIEDPDRKRRKQAEFLVYREMPFNAILGIATHATETKTRVDSILSIISPTIRTIVKPDWFY